MSSSNALDAFLGGGAALGADAELPLVRLLRQKKGEPGFAGATLEVRRPRSALGFMPAVMLVHIKLSDGRELDVRQEDWDDDLNSALVREHVRATGEANEALRFGLALDAGFEKAEMRFGDGFFSSVLVDFIRTSPFAGEPAVSDVLKYASTRPPSAGGEAGEDCRRMIAGALRDKWKELLHDLGYDPDAAQRILVEAVAYYLDERFSVTDRQKLGWA